ncbi:hypothetical protein VFPPC_11470 [Pochonia chlamydosporia 170]|uniref:Uncharacterized protein n=1 Tax=Pochonia chlamydosporia 170 TaxID=1380566 RepID=A0A179F0J2_METCM|nr:hypothetical protein VFPPC_11470 [Pochonia chlamydosporia 170]OAQ58975.2 hypothetical protein VFPPC_11470 [Pochonia chlamydosporia 170]
MNGPQSYNHRSRAHDLLFFSIAQTSYPPNQSYGISAHMMPGTTRTASHSQPIVPASSARYDSPTLHPMPPNGLTGQPGVTPPCGSASVMLPNRVVYNGALPPRVVGSQGRRGSLLCNAGRPVVPAAGEKYNAVQTKDADGKYPCPHCAKSYLSRQALEAPPAMPALFAVATQLDWTTCAVLKLKIKNRAQAEKTCGLSNEKARDQTNELNNIPSDVAAYPIDTSPVSHGMNKVGDGSRGPFLPAISKA